MLQFMKNKVLIPLIIMGFIAAFLSFRYIKELEPNVSTSVVKKEMVLQTILAALEQGHFAPRAVDDSFSKSIYNKFISNLDYEKKFFTKIQIDSISFYEYALDDELKAGNIYFFQIVNAMFSSQIKKVESYYKEILNKKFTFDSKDSVLLNGDKLDFAANDQALYTRWYAFLKYRALSKYHTLKSEQNALKDSSKKAIVLKSDDSLEVEARRGILKDYDSYFKRLKKLDENDRFTIFINALTSCEDPHTDYFPPKDKKAFDESMSGTFYGIGAQLKIEDGKVKIVNIVTGSPCWKQGELKANDEILKVGQGKEEPVDVQGYDIEDVVKIIRGEKGTEVRLTIKRLDGTSKVIPIIRGAVLMEEVFAKSAIINDKNSKIGYIYLPEFYADFQHRNGRHCSEDIKKEIEKLKAENVSKIILDLRENGGGSLGDVVDIAGFFIDQGPIVQVKNSFRESSVLSDKNPGTLFDGSLAILVNQNSASASEILAAAMQDYNRAIIIGTPTYGKGTVQNMLSLDDFSTSLGDFVEKAKAYIVGKENTEMGALKITIQKFYRINGGSTQLKGVTPDIILPSAYEDLDIGERKDKAALKWDEIAPASYSKSNKITYKSILIAASQKRVNLNPLFTFVKQTNEKLKKKEQYNYVQLKYEDFKKEMDEAAALSKKAEELQKKTNNLNITNLNADFAKVNIDSSSIIKNKEWLKNLNKDIYLSEAVQIIRDIK